MKGGKNNVQGTAEIPTHVNIWLGILQDSHQLDS
jgi:hypothetical protein